MVHRVRDLLGVHRLTGKLREGLLAEARELSREDLVSIEDGEYFLTSDGRTATLSVVYRGRTTGPAYRYRRRRYRRW